MGGGVKGLKSRLGEDINFKISGEILIEPFKTRRVFENHHEYLVKQGFLHHFTLEPFLLFLYGVKEYFYVLDSGFLD